MKKLTAIIIGAGGRGAAYAQIMKEMPEKFEVVGVADPIRARQEHIKKLFDLPEEACFPGFDEILNQPKMADIAVIATMDDIHTEPALRAIELGYDLLLEKPVAQTPEECIAIAKAAEEHGRSVLVCHVLRYTRFYKAVKEAVMSGRLGEIQSVIAVEGVGNVHQSHSYVRGDWHKESETTPMLLAKCCHDLDIIQWILDKPCKKVSSFGQLSHFTPENAPAGAPKHCYGTDCPVRENCFYSVEKVYLQNATWMSRTAARGYTKEFWPTEEELRTALADPKNNFGACVYHAGNDVVDHQVVNMEFEDGCTASLTMNAFNKGGRYIRLFGTKGELYANASDTEITLWDFATREATTIPVKKTEESIAGGHGGGDTGIIEELYEYLIGEYTGFCAADIDISIKNHLIGFAAEKARRNDTIENIVDYCKRFNFEYK
jgi:predicted dehydrogenase